jgi:hypothetical protein
MLNIVLLPLTAKVRLDEVLAATNAATIVVADCYVTDSETWSPRPWGWETTVGGRCVINVDHHAPDPRFYRNVSSGNLASQYVREQGPADLVVINHTDCDSVISSALLAGLIPPKSRYDDAVIAADHTGATNVIADLLQSLDPLRDLDASLRNLRLLEKGKSIEPVAARLIRHRLEERERARKLVEDGTFTRIGLVAEATLGPGQRVPGEFLPSLLPDAWAIVSGSPMEGGLWETKIRLGSAAPAGANLFSMGVSKAEPAFGGRWNAGSTKRHGGSAIAPREVAERLTRLIEQGVKSA